MDLNSLPDISSIFTSIDSKLSLILMIGTGSVIVLLILLKLAFRSMHKIDRQIVLDAEKQTSE